MNSEAQDLPLDLVVVADFGFADGVAARIRRLESDGLGTLMAEARPSVTFEAGGAPVTITVTDPRGFRPEAIAPQIPEARALLELRERVTRQGIRLAELKEIVAGLAERSPLKRALSGIVDGGSAPPAAAPAPPLAAPAPPAAVAPAELPAVEHADSVEALFQMVDLGDPPPAGARDTAGAPAAAATPASNRALDRLVRLLGIGSSAGTVSTATQQGLAGALDEALADTIRPVLHDPRFQALEQTWSGLRFLMRRIDHRSGVRVHLLPARRAELAKRFREVFVPFAEDQRREARVPVAIVDFDLGVEHDLDLAADLCASAAAVHAPVLAGLDPALLGVPSFEAVERIENLAERMNDAAHAAWNALRARDASRWLVLCANRFLLRVPYGRETERVKGFAFEEHAVDAAPYLWGRAIWILAERIAASFARCGWGVELTGQDEELRAGDLPVRMAATRLGESAPLPLEALLTERTVLELADQGVLALVCARDADFAFLATAPAVHGSASDGAQAVHSTRRDSLPYAMFDAQVNAWAAHLLAFGRFGSNEERGAALAQGITRLATTRSGPLLEATVESGAVRIAPWRPPLRGLPELILPLSP
jgi:type VI secretion system protein ImpC